MSSLEGLDLTQTPAGVPPPGVIPNFVNPESKANAVIAVGAVMMTVTALMVSARLYSNYTSLRKLHIDDYFCAIATILSFTYTGLILSVNDYFRHQWDLPLSMLNAWYFKILYCQDMLLGPTILFGKLAILFLFLRIFNINPVSRYLIYFAIFLAFALGSVNIPLGSIFCTPHPGGSWGDFSIGTKCERTSIWGVIGSCIDIFLDLLIFFLPIPPVIRLKMSLGRKIWVIAVFAVAVLGIVASALVMVYRIKLWKSIDIAWAQSHLFIFLIIENFVAIIVSCAPACASFVKAGFIKISFSSFRTMFLGGKRSNSATEYPKPSTKAKNYPVPVVRSDSHEQLQDNGHYEMIANEGHGWTPARSRD